MAIRIPLAIFDSMQYIAEQIDFSHLPDYNLSDIRHAIAFLTSYTGSQGTFNSYRREIERLIHFAAIIKSKGLPDLDRRDIEDFIAFCQKPPKEWIGTSKPPRFVNKAGLRRANIQWRPFVATVSKVAHRDGHSPSILKFSLSHGAVRELMAILSSFYNYLVQEDYCIKNPVALIRQKNKYIRKTQSGTQVRRLSELQWQYVINTAKQLAQKDPKSHQRTLFIMSSLYAMYLRISELAASTRWVPSMNDFSRDIDGNWWFSTVGKGNKQRSIAVSESMLDALKTWRQYLQLTPLPSAADNSPLLPKTRGNGPMRSTNHIRRIVQFCFDAASEQLIQDNMAEEADSLKAATVHWLRHTGISDDVKLRPREHVRDDAGHSSSAITDKYIDIELRERHASAKDKIINEDD